MRKLVRAPFRPLWPWLAVVAPPALPSLIPTTSILIIRIDPLLLGLIVLFQAGPLLAAVLALMTVITAILLATSDYLLKCSSSVSETAIYFNPALATDSVDLQYACGHRSWLAKGIYGEPAAGCIRDPKAKMT